MSTDDGETWDLSDNDLAALRAVLAELTRLHEENERLVQDAIDAGKRIEVAESSLTALRADVLRLQPYVQHKPNCPALPANTDRYTLSGRPFRDCDCGLADALAVIGGRAERE